MPISIDELKGWKVYRRIGKLVMKVLSEKGFKNKDEKGKELIVYAQYKKILSKTVFDLFTEYVLNDLVLNHKEWNEKIPKSYWFNDSKEHGGGDPKGYMNKPEFREGMSKVDEKEQVLVYGKDLMKMFCRYKDMYRKDGLIIKVSKDKKIVIDKGVNKEIKDWLVFVDTAQSVRYVLKDKWGFHPRDDDYILDKITDRAVREFILPPVYKRKYPGKEYDFVKDEDGKLQDEEFRNEMHDVYERDQFYKEIDFDEKDLMSVFEKFKEMYEEEGMRIEVVDAGETYKVSVKKGGKVKYKKLDEVVEGVSFPGRKGAPKVGEVVKAGGVKVKVPSKQVKTDTGKKKEPKKEAKKEREKEKEKEPKEEKRGRGRPNEGKGKGKRKFDKGIKSYAFFNTVKGMLGNGFRAMNFYPKKEGEEGGIRLSKFHYDYILEGAAIDFCKDFYLPKLYRKNKVWLENLEEENYNFRKDKYGVILNDEFNKDMVKEFEKNEKVIEIDDTDILPVVKKYADELKDDGLTLKIIDEGENGYSFDVDDKKYGDEETETDEEGSTPLPVYVVVKKKGRPKSLSVVDKKIKQWIKGKGITMKAIRKRWEEI
ncbi:hypothetical protein FACS189472_07040 [Alphaproteobacteria bacterium]|nr:hypothetical protein FACS189472_07040 [Alphaproteobacteria bacterium]